MFKTCNVIQESIYFKHKKYVVGHVLKQKKIVYIVIALLSLCVPIFHSTLLKAASSTWSFDTPGDYSYDTDSITVTAGAASVKTRSDWYNNSWNYRKSLAITGSVGQSLTDYQVKIDVTYDAAMQIDFDDLVFTSSDGTTALNYWLESKVDGVSAVVWVMLPSLPASPTQTQVYMYYGNSGASSASSLANTAMAGTDFGQDDGYSIIENSISESYGNLLGTIRTGSKTVAIGDAWKSRTSLSSGRFDTIDYLGNGVVVTGSRGSSNAGHIVRSTDYGTTWQDVGDITGGVNITNVKSAGNGKVYALTGQSRVYRSTDYGLTWTDLGVVSPNTSFNPTYQLSYGLYASGDTVMISDTKAGGGQIFRSTDSGANWTNLGSFTSAALYNFEPVGDGILVMSWAGVIMKSTDNGANWVSKGTVGGSSPLYGHRYLGNNTVVVANGAGGIYRSTNNGENWSTVGSSSSMEADNILNLGGGRVLYSTYTGSKTTYYSSDYGANWTSRGVFTGSVSGDYIDGNVLIDDAPGGAVALAVTNQGYILTSRATTGAFLQKVSLDRANNSSMKKALPSTISTNFAVRTKVNTLSVANNAAWQPVVAISTDGNRMCSTTGTYGIAVIQRGNLGIGVLEFTGSNNTPCYSGITEISTTLNREYTVEIRKTSTTSVSIAIYDWNNNYVGGNSLAISSQNYQYLMPHFAVPSGWSAATASQDIDYTFVRKYVASEPAVGAFSAVQEKYVAGSYQIVPTSAQEFTGLNGFTDDVLAPDGGGVTYQVSSDGGSTWYWYTGGQWTSTSANVGESNDAATINSHISSLPIGSGDFTFKAFLTTNGVQSVQLNGVDLDYDNLGDTEPPAVLAAPQLKPASDTGASDSDGITNDQTPSFVGSCSSGDTVKLYIDGSVAEQQTCQSNSYDIELQDELLDDVYEITVTATDTSSNESSPSPALAITIDTAPSAAPIITAPADDSLTNDSTPAFAGTGVAGDTIALKDGSTTLCTATVTGGNTWSCTPGSALADGVYSLTAIATDVAGNQSSASTALSITVDSTPPSAPAITSPTNGSLGNDTTPTFSGTGVSGDAITVRHGSTEVCTTMVVDDEWSCVAGSALGDGVYGIAATATDPAGNASAASSAVSITIDSTPPAAPVITAPTTGSSSSDTTPTFTGTGVSGTTITVKSGSTVLCSTTAAGNGSWSCTTGSTMVDGSYTITATATDAAGNESGASTAVALTINSSQFDYDIAYAEENASLTATVNTSLNSTAILILAAGDSYANSTSVSSSTPDTDHVLIISDLVGCGTYTYKVIITESATDIEHSSGDRHYTAPCINGSDVEAQITENITTQDGGIIALDGEELVLEVPVGYKDDVTEAYFQVKKLNKEQALATTSQPQNVVLIGDALYEILAFKDPFTLITEFDKPLTLTLKTNRQDSTILTWHAEPGWDSLQNCVAGSGQISCNVQSFSIFGVFANESIIAQILPNVGIIKSNFEYIVALLAALAIAILSRFWIRRESTVRSHDV